MSPSIKYCIVPQCKNTATKTPEKLFFQLPMDPKIRKKWTNVIRRAHPLGQKTIAYCCEDHFDVSILTWSLLVICFLVGRYRGRYLLDSQCLITVITETNDLLSLFKVNDHYH